MWILIVMILAVVSLDLAATLWGTDSRESSQNPEWTYPERVEPAAVSELGLWKR